MSRILARLKNVREDGIKSILKVDAELHEKDALELRNLWQYEEHSDDVLFLFCDYIRKRKTNPDAHFKIPEENLNQVYNTNFFKRD